MSREAQFREAIKEAAGALAEHLHPGPRDCEATFKKVLAVFDTDDIGQAIEDSEKDEPNGDQQTAG